VICGGAADDEVGTLPGPLAGYERHFLLWGAENLCHQAIFMNHGADAVTSLNPDPVKVGDVAGESAQRCGLLQGAVSSDAAVGEATEKAVV
jgi:hypothetical protein